MVLLMANNKHRTMIGGQAVIEGVMMRGVKNASMSVRTPDGTIATESWEVVSARDKYAFLKLPFLRGIVNFVEMLIYGYKTLMRSAELAGLEDEEPNKKNKKIENKDQENKEEENKEDTEASKKKQSKLAEKATSLLLVLSALIGVAFSILIFIITPTTITVFLSKTPAFSHIGAFKTLFEGLIRIVIFVIYLALVSRMKDIQRVFEYHGAEHKTIFCYEHDEELTVENARKYKRLHPRCGTSFLLIVFIISILVFSLPFVTWSNIPLRVLLHILLLPFVVGIAYEIIKFAGRHDNSVMRFLLAPGLWLQMLTTREPDDSQLEVAIESLKAVLTGNREDDKW
jgi:uncharacterized protein YqhQ